MNPHVVCMPTTATVRSAVHAFIEHNISGVPVTTPDGRTLVGMLSTSDIIVTHTHADGREIKVNAMHIPFMDKTSAELLGKLERVLNEPVEAYMQTASIVAAPTAKLGSVVALMMEKRINRLPIVEGAEVVGILTRSDILRALARTVKGPADLMSL